MASEYKCLNSNDEEQSLMTENCDNCSVSVAEFPNNHYQRSRKCLKSSFSILKDFLLILFAILGFFSLIKPSANIHTYLHPEGAATSKYQTATIIASCDCGNSTAEAVALGCKYDSLAAAWLPEHCRDDELTAEFERAGPGVDGKWTYWTDAAHTNEISVAEIAKMGDTPELRFHMTGHWHVVHCIFYWRKEHRARFSGKIVEPRSDSEKHIKHCGNIFLDPGHDTVAGVPLNTDDE